jgi:hypothetical protein
MNFILCFVSSAIRLSQQRQFNAMCEDSCGGVQRSGALQEKNESRKSATFELCGAAKWNATTGRSLPIMFMMLYASYVLAAYFFFKRKCYLSKQICAVFCVSLISTIHA